MSESTDRPSSQDSPFIEGDTGDHSPSKEPTRVVVARTRISDLNDTIVLEQLHLDPGTREGSLGRIGAYEVIDIIGRGGMGIVLRAFDATLHRTVAIKVISPSMLTTKNARDRFLFEARAAGGINHSNVVVVHAVGEHAGFPYLVMEFVEGQSLQQRIKAGVPLSELEVVKISLQIARGLQAAHRQGIIHRDIKPGNIMLQDDSDEVKITDFGLARTTFESEELTADGGIVGTPAFMSPEQVLDQALDHRTDLFSLGCVIYAMFVGHSPFRSESPIASATKVHGVTHSSLRTACPDVPDYLEAIVDRLLAKNPQDRYQSAQAVVDVLAAHLAKLSREDVEETQAWTQQRATSAGRGNRRIVWGTLLVACLVVMASTLAFVMRPKDAAVPATTPLEPRPAAAQRKLTVARTGTAQFRDLREALAQATPGCTIEVTDGSTYPGPFEISDPQKFKGVQLVATRKPLINVRGHATCLTISGIENFQLRGFRFETEEIQHGIEVVGHCPGTTITDCEFLALQPRGDVRASIHLRGGASGTSEAPLTIRRCRIEGGGVGIVLAAHNDVEPVSFARIEECFIQGDGRDFGVGIALQTGVRDTVIQRNLLRSGACGFSMVFNEPDTAQNVTIRDNSFDRFERVIRLNDSNPRQTVQIRSNLMIDSYGVSSGKRQVSEYRSWFAGNWWEICPGCDESTVTLVADLQSGVPLLSRDPGHPDYLKPGANADSSMPGRYRMATGNSSPAP